MRIMDMDTSVDKLPPCRILLRSKESVELFYLQDNGKKSGGITLVRGSSTGHFFYPDGSNVLILMPNIGVIRRNLSQLSTLEDKSVAFLESSKAVQFLSFSPKGTFVVTWERAQKIVRDTSEGIIPNLKIWNAMDGKLLHSFPIKNMRKDQWPPLQWTHDEALAFFMVTNQLHVYKGDAFSNSTTSPDNGAPQYPRYDSKVACSGIGSFSFPTKVYGSTASDKYVFCAFCPEVKGKPAKVSLLRYPDRCGNAENPSSGPVLTSKSCYQAEDCAIKWSPKGDAALILTHTTVDATGASYYGSSLLYLLLSETDKGVDGEGDAISVPLPSGKTTNTQTGPVLDAAWMPNPTKPSCFAVISGRMPAMASLHHGSTAEPTFLFGNAHRNTIVWSDHGRFITLGGFGNLAGGMDFFDRNKLKPMPQYDLSTGKELGPRGNNAPCAVGYAWAPDSRYFMVSTTSPRMNVDNGVRLYKYNGLEIQGDQISWDNMKYRPDKLLAAEFVPSPLGFYPDRPQSPPPERSGDTNENETDPIVSGPSKVSANVDDTAAYVPPMGRYVPPAARKLGGAATSGGSLAERMRKEREANTVVATKVVPKISSAGPGARVPIGMMPVEKPKRSSTVKKETQRESKPIDAVKVEEKLDSATKEDTEASTSIDPEKRSKKLKKLLKQIEELKEKDPSTLNDDQQQKIASEADVIKELAQLGL